MIGKRKKSLIRRCVGRLANLGWLPIHVNSGRRGNVRLNYWHVPVDWIDRLEAQGIDLPALFPDRNPIAVLEMDIWTEGVPDILAVGPNGRLACLEIKDAGDRIRPAQIVFLALADSLGHLTAIVRHPADLDRILEPVPAWRNPQTQQTLRLYAS